MARERIHKVLAELGVASRRAAEQMVLDGRVRLNGQVLRTLPAFADPAEDVIEVDGEPVRTRPMRRVYYLLNKPKGVVCTQSDPGGRPRAVDLIPPIAQRVYCVGRLDKDSTGLLLLTNDGELTERLTHPRYGVTKTYVVQVDGAVSGEQIERLKGGMHLDGKKTKRAGVKVLKRSAARSRLEIRLSEGRNREIRRLLARVGHKVRRLQRVAIGPIRDPRLKLGAHRPLRPNEIRKLREAADLA